MLIVQASRWIARLWAALWPSFGKLTDSGAALQALFCSAARDQGRQLCLSVTLNLFQGPFLQTSGGLIGTMDAETRLA